MNFSNFEDWKKTLNFSPDFQKTLANLQIKVFFFNASTQKISLTLFNSFPIKLIDAQQITQEFKKNGVKQIYWTYEKLDFASEKSGFFLLEYLQFFLKKMGLKISLPQIKIKKDPFQIIFFNQKKNDIKALHLYERELYMFFEEWGIDLPEVVFHDDQNLLSNAFFTSKNITKSKTPASKSSQFSNVNQPIAKFVENKFEKIPEFVEGKKFCLQGEVLKIHSQTFDNKKYTNILIDTFAAAYILFFYKNLNADSMPKKGEWHKFDCVFKRKKFNYRFKSQKESIECENFVAIDPLFPRHDLASEKRIELHCHTKMSSLDAVVDSKSYLNLAKHFGHSAIAFTDHENIHAFSDLSKQIDNFPDQKIIFGCEFNIIPDHWKAITRPAPIPWSEIEFAILDIETTGLSLHFDEIIEFAVIVLKNGFKVKETHFLIKTVDDLSPETVEMTKITPQKLRTEGIEAAEAASQISKLLKGKVIVAHNAFFDFNFLNQFLIKHNYSQLTNTVIDTLPLGHYVLPGKKSYRLGRLARHFGVTYQKDKAHRAFYDTQILADLFVRMIEKEQLNSLKKIEDINLHLNVRQRAIPWHMNVLVQNEKGLKNLYRLISITHTKTLYQNPVLEKADFEQHKEGLLIGSGCYNSEIFQLAAFHPPEEFEKAINSYDYIEVQPPEVYQHFVDRKIFTQAQIKQIIKKIIIAAKKHNKIIVATGDVHFLHPEEGIYRDIYIFNKQLKGKFHPLYDFQDRIKTTPPQFFRSTEEMKSSFQFLADENLIHEIVVTNTHLIANKINKINFFSSKVSLPTFKDGEKKLIDISRQKLAEKYGKKIDSKIQKRFDQELNQIITHGYGTIYLIAKYLTSYSLEKGYLIGSRGSVGSSFLAYCLDITEVNPLSPHYYCQDCSFVEWIEKPATFSGFDLPSKKCPSCPKNLISSGQTIGFESFLGIDGTNLPDIDLNFSGVFQNEIQNHLIKLITNFFGPEKIFRAGTVSAVAEKTAFGYWASYREKFALPEPPHAEIEKILQKIAGVKRTTGQHPGGLFIVPQQFDIHDFTPYQFPSNKKDEKVLTTHFDYNALGKRLLKIDLLGHDDPTGLRILGDLTKKNPKSIPMVDANVIQLFSDVKGLGITSDQINGEKTGCLGLPEFGTDFVRRILRDFPVQSFADLVSVSGLSHGKNVWESNARDLLKKSPQLTFQDVIACRDDIMNFLLAQKVSKLLAYETMQKIKKGKGLSQTEEKKLLELGVARWFIDSCQKITYLFPKAHATAYSIMAYRFAWYKLHFPVEFYATYFSIRCEVFDLLTITQGFNAIRDKIKEINKKIRNNNKDVSTKDRALIPVYNVALEMYARKIQFRSVDLVHSAANEFIVLEEDGQKVIYPPFSAVDRLGPESAQQIVIHRDEKLFVTEEDFLRRTKVNQAIYTNLKESGAFRNLRFSPQKNFFS